MSADLPTEVKYTPPSEPEYCIREFNPEATYDEEDKSTNGFSLQSSVKDSLLKIIQICLEEDNIGSLSSSSSSSSSSSISSLASEAERRVKEFKEMKEKEKKELERSVVSLTEENRDIHSLLRVALKGHYKSTSSTPEQQKSTVVGPLLEFAERGLQRVGLFGFTMMPPIPATTGGRRSTSATTAEEASGISLDREIIREDSGITGTESAAQAQAQEETLPHLASAVERIMKNLRLEIMQLRSTLEESRSDAERLQCLTEKQAEEIADNTMYIKELEDRERILAQNVADLLTDIKATEIEVTRWKEACELEVEAAKKEIGERDILINILKQEVEKTKGALQVSNGKLKLKEEVAEAAMVAQAAAERSLQLVDSRTSGLRRQIEELMRQVEETEKRNQNHFKVWRVCFPWTSFRINPLNNANYEHNNNTRTRRGMVPEMQSLLH